MRKLLIAFAILFCLPTPVQAAFSLKIESISQTEVKSFDDELNIVASISGLPSESYFRVAWQKNSGDTYFGYLKNNLLEWVKIFSTQDCKNYYKVSDTNLTNFSIFSKVGEDNIIENGDYNLKLRRYTQTCSSYVDSDPVVVRVLFPTPTPSPTPTSTSSPTDPPKTSSPQPTKTSLSTPTIVATKKPTTSPTGISGLDINTPVPTEVGTSEGDFVLGVSMESPKPSNAKNNNVIPLIFIGSGIVFIALPILQFMSANKKNSQPS